MKPIAIIALAIALEAGFLLSASLPPAALARAGSAMKGTVATIVRSVLPDDAEARRS